MAYKTHLTHFYCSNNESSISYKQIFEIVINKSVKKAFTERTARTHKCSYTRKYL